MANAVPLFQYGTLRDQEPSWSCWRVALPLRQGLRRSLPSCTDNVDQLGIGHDPSRDSYSMLQITRLWPPPPPKVPPRARNPQQQPLQLSRTLRLVSPRRRSRWSGRRRCGGGSSQGRGLAGGCGPLAWRGSRPCQPPGTAADSGRRSVRLTRTGAAEGQLSWRCFRAIRGSKGWGSIKRD